MEENTVGLVIGMTPKELEPETTVELREACLRQPSLRETKLWWTTTKKEKQDKVFLKFKKCWYNLRMKWYNRLLVLNYLFQYIESPLKLIGRPIKRSVKSPKSISHANITPTTASVTSTL